MSANNTNFEVDKEVESLLNSVAVEENLNNYQIVKVSGSIKGDGYLGVIHRLRIDGTDKSTGRKRQINVITKCAPKSKALRDSTPINEVFGREIYMYNTLLPSFSNFEKESGVTKPFGSVAKCYKTQVSELHETLVLENLKEAGYAMWDRQLRMNPDHVELVFKEYGKFHAISYAFRDQKRELFDKLTCSLDDVMVTFLDKTGFDKAILEHLQKGLNTLEKIADAKYYSVFEKFMPTALDFLRNLPNCIDDYCAVLHGDCWCNNMMFKYNEVNKLKPTQLCFLDWQLSHVGSPVLDLSYYFYSSCSGECQDNYKYYLRQYYNSLSSHLRDLGSDPEKLYPFAKLEEHWKKYSRFGLIMATVLVHIMYSEKDEVQDLSEIAESGKAITDAFSYESINADKYNKVISHTIKHFVDHNFI